MGAGPSLSELPANVLVVDRSVPIQYLLSQCALAAHCACTLWTGATLKAGKKQKKTSNKNKNKKKTLSSSIS
jgi:hypothetical protein